MQVVPRNGTAQSEERTEYITKNWKFKTDEEMGIYLGINYKSVANYRCWLGFRRPSYNAVSMEKKALIGEMFCSYHYTLHEISHKLKMSIHTVTNFITNSIFYKRLDDTTIVITLQSSINYD